MAEKKEEKREQVLSAAKEVFLQYGISKLTLEDVAQRIGLAVSSLYYYFPNKQELLKAIIDDQVEHLIRAMREAMNAAEGPEEKLLSIGRALVGEMKVLIAHPGFNQQSLARAEEMIPCSGRHLREEHRSMLHEVLSAGVAQGVFDVDDIELTSYVLAAGTYGVVETMMDPEAPRRLLDDVHVVEHMLMNGLKKR